ncbi:MAG TPA: nucleotide exchange factor GrpE [Actinobacteria bacterium]|nr:nucleotide exchange factor GrpE [Actinomycetota bacterium]
MSDEEFTGPRVTDRRRVDPNSGEVRQPAGPAGAPDPLLEEAVEAALVEAEVGEVERKLAELTADLQRVHAEYANYRKRVDRDRELIRQNAVGGVLTELIAVLDDIDRARQHGELEGAFKTVGEALESSVTRMGLERYGASGEPFDPTIHEALTHEASDEVSEPTVVAVYQPGYRYSDRVLRPARVAVAGDA